MVTEFVVSAVLAIFRALVAPLPVYTLDTAAMSAQSSQVGALAMTLNGYAPVSQLAIALGLLGGLKLALLAWQGVVFVYHQFWGSS